MAYRFNHVAGDRAGIRGQEMLQLMRLGVVPFGTLILSIAGADEPELTASDLAGLNPDMAHLRRNVQAFRPVFTRILRERWSIGSAFRLTGVTGAGPIFRDVMLYLHEHRDPKWPAQPAGLVRARIDPRSGKRNVMVIGHVVAIHIDDAFIVNGRFDTARAQPLRHPAIQASWLLHRLTAFPLPA